MQPAVQPHPFVMGDGMVSLYMTSWEGVQDYQRQEFMQDVFRWLLAR